MKDKLDLFLRLMAIVALFVIIATYLNRFASDVEHERRLKLRKDPGDKPASVIATGYEWRIGDTDSAVYLYFGEELYGLWNYDGKYFRPCCLDRRYGAFTPNWYAIAEAAPPSFAPPLPKRGALQNGVVRPNGRPTGEVN